MRLQLLFTLLFAASFVHAQNVGIGTDTPTEKLEVNGGVKIGPTNITSKGTIRWNEAKKDFEGYNGTT